MDMPAKQQYELMIEQLLMENVKLRSEKVELHNRNHSLRVELHRYKVDPTYDCAPS